jgi:hypothetical protein
MNNTQSLEEQKSSKNSEREESDEKIIYHCLRRPENDTDTSSESETSYKTSHARDKLMCLTIIDELGDENSDEGIIFNLKSIKAHLSESGSPKASLGIRKPQRRKVKGVENDQNPPRKFIKKFSKKCIAQITY